MKHTQFRSVWKKAPLKAPIKSWFLVLRSVSSPTLNVTCEVLKQSGECTLNNDEGLPPDCTSLALFRIAVQKHRWFKESVMNSESGFDKVIDYISDTE